MPKVYNRGVKVQDAQDGEGYSLLDNPLYPKVNRHRSNPHNRAAKMA